MVTWAPRARPRPLRPPVGWKRGRDAGSGTRAAESGVSGFVFVCFSAATTGVVESCTQTDFVYADIPKTDALPGGEIGVFL